VKLVDRAVERPLSVFMLALLLVAAGIWSLSELPINRAPKIDIPFTLVFAIYEGAAPEDVESEVTIELEEELNTLEALRHISSVSREGVSTHFLQFEDRTDMTETLRDARDRADLAEVKFPDAVDGAVVKELSFDDEPIVFFTLTGGADLYRLRAIGEDLKPVLQAVKGVSDVEVFGGYEREVRVHADPRVLSQHGLTLDDLALAIQRQSRSLPAGELRSPKAQRLIRATGEFRTLREIGSITVANEPAGPLSLRDVATIELGHERVTSRAWWNGQASVTLIVRRRPDVDTLETIDRLRGTVDALRSQLPPGVEIVATADQSEDIGRMLDQLGTSAAFGMVLVLAVLFVMFGVRQALLVSSVLPFSLLFTMIGLYALDMGVSNISLFALILVLGLVVDGAIVVGEAIYAERESGEKPAAAAKLAIRRVGMPVISADLTTIAAFVPMLLMVGVMGQFMSVLPKVVIFALIGSVFVDHLLLPAASARFPGKARARRGPLAPDGLPWFSPDLPRVRSLYRRALERALERRPSVLAGAVGAFAIAILLYTSGIIGSIFLPSVDAGRFTVNYELPLGTGLDETSRVGRLLAQEVAVLPELESYVLTTGDTGALATQNREGGEVGSHYGRLTVELLPRVDRDRGQADVVADLRQRMRRYAGVTIDIREPDEGPPTGAALAIRVKGERLEEVASVAGSVEQRLLALPGAQDVRVDYDPGKPEIRVELDRPRAASEFGISPDAVSRVLLTAFYGAEVGRMWYDGERVDILLKAPGTFAHTLDNVRELPLRAEGGALVPLGEVADVGLSSAHSAIYRHDTRRAVTIRADNAEGYSSVALEEDARSALAGLVLPAGVDLEYGGESEERDRSYASLLDAVKWGLLLIYVVIAIQFNSLLQPLIVLLSIPLAIVGVSLGLLLTGTPFSFMVFIGVVSLTGIVVNSGIVMIDAINKKRRAGMPVEEAIREASIQRLRPVLLTAVTTVAGLLPLTLNITEGGEFWAPLGVAIISGLLASTALTLFVVPVLYSLLEGRPGRPSLELVRESLTARLPSATPGTGAADPSASVGP
jgi:CzcA family heavy metal efflux pump